MLVVPMPPQTSHLHSPSTDAPSYSRPPPPTTTAAATTAPPPGDTRTKIASRPKLSLQTTSLPRTFGRSTTGLSVSLAAASPTVNNTFKNAYEPCPPSAIPATPSSSTASPTKSSSQKFTKPASPFPSYNSGNPYQLTLGVKSILRNSPLEHTAHRRSRSVNSGNGASGSRRVFFPPKKQVSYRQPLEEEIRTVHYVARHSDLLAEESDSDSDRHPEKTVREGQALRNENGVDSDSDSSSSLAPSDSSGSDDDHTGSTAASKSERKKRKNLSAERKVRAVALMDGLENDPYDASTPQTPCQSRVKRRREWRWTLGSFEARNEAYGLPRTPEEAKSFAASQSSTPVSSIPSESEWESKHPENNHETESLGSCESGTSTSLGSSSTSHTKSDDPKTHES